MWPSLRHGVIATTLAGCVGLAAAQTGFGQRNGGTDASVMDETTGSVVGSPKRSTAELALSDEQRGRIYDGVMRMPDTPVAQVPAPARRGCRAERSADAGFARGRHARHPAGAGPQIREVRRPDRRGRAGEPPGGGDDPTLQAPPLALAVLAVHAGSHGIRLLRLRSGSSARRRERLAEQRLEDRPDPHGVAEFSGEPAIE